MAYPAGVATAPAVAVAPEVAEAIVAGAAARPGRIAGQLAADPAGARATLAVAADSGKAGARVDLVVLELLPAAGPVLAMVAAMLGMTKVELVVKLPVAGQVPIEPYLVEEALGALCARQRLEEQVYLVQETLAVPYVLHS